MTAINANIHLTKFNLTTPELNSSGGAMTYWPPIPEGANFSVTEQGEARLWAQTKGASTANSDRTRTEFREIAEGTGTPFNFQLNQYAERWLRAALTLEQVTENGKVVVGQIHVAGNDRPLLKILWDNGKLRAKVRQVYNQSDDPSFTLSENIPLGTRFSYSIKVAGRHVSVFVTVGTVKTTLVFPLSASWEGKDLYFKAGLYNQEDWTESTPDSVGSLATFHILYPETVQS